MSDAIEDVTIVGGGDSGLLTGLALRQLNPDLDVTVVDDFSEDTTEIGKSTFFKIFDILHEFLEIDQERFTRSVKPIWKCSVYFRDWCDLPSFHFPFDNQSKFPDASTADSIQPLHYLYQKEQAEDLTINEEIVAQGKSPWYYDAQAGGYQMHQPIAYHLDTERFNALLRELCRERGVSLLDDAIETVEVSDGRIDGLRSKSQRYEADLYVDATGFNRLLKERVGGQFRDFGLPLDSAYNARYDRPLSEVVPATVVESADDGWFWEIDTFDNRDVGYVYASEFVSDEDALETFLEHTPEEVTEADAAQYDFTSGYYEDAWAENLLVIGNAGGFVEPLESTGLTFNADAAVRLSVLLSAHGRIDDDGLRETYNAFWRRSWESIYDFIVLHYTFAPGETSFWERMRSMAVSDRVERIVEAYDATGFDTHGFEPTEHGTDVEPLNVFRVGSCYTLIRNMGRTSEFYESHDFEVSEEMQQVAEQAHEHREQRVERDHITTEEFYRGVDDPR